jgi:DNA-binding LytR/AlgR family response regulator
MMGILKIAICDDQGYICNELEEMLEIVEKDINYAINIDVFHDGNGLLSHIKIGNKYDIIFLDIEMGNVDGIEVGKTIRDEFDDELTKIVYISAYEKYSMDLHKIRAMDFLIKPITQDDVEKTIKTAIKLLKKPKAYLRYTKDNRAKKALIADILYFESSSRQIKIVMTNGDEHFYGKLSEFSDDLDRKIFFTVHKSYIVNYNHIKESTYEQIKMNNGDTIPISQSNRKTVRKKLLEKRV